MAQYTDLEIETDAATLTGNGLQQFADEIPNYQPAAGNPEVVLTEVTADMAADVAVTASFVPPVLWRNFGTFLGFAPQEAVQAIGSVTFTLTETGHTIPAGTYVIINEVPFTTVEDLVIASGTTGSVGIVAVDAGVDANGLQTPVELGTAFAWVANVSVDGVTSGGVDAESDDDFNDRVALLTPTLTDTPITAEDYALIALAQPGIGRATAIDNTDPFPNLLTANGSSVETDAVGFVAGTNTGVARSTSAASHGTASLQVARQTSTGDAVGSSPPSSAVTPGRPYVAMAEFRAGTTARSCTLSIDWYTAANALISSNTSAAQNDTTSGWVPFYVTGTAPATASYARIRATFIGCAVSESHYVDKLGIKEGYNTTWYLGGTYGTNLTRTVAVIVTDEAGQPLAPASLLELQQFFEVRREANFIVVVANPTYVAITVAADVRVLSGYDSAGVIAEVEAAVEEYLSPTGFGTNAIGGDINSPWVLDTKVRYLDVAAIVRGVPGVQYINSLAVNGGTADVTMSGAAPLPVGTATVTAS